MDKACPRCGDGFKTGELVELVIIAPYQEIPSKVAFSIGKPIDSYPDSLQHHSCPSQEEIV